MSFDVMFVPTDMRDRWREAMEQIERATVANESPTPEAVDQASAVIEAVVEQVPGFVREGEHLLHESTWVTVGHYPGQITMSVPYSAGPPFPVGRVLEAVAAVVEQGFDLVAFDPQASQALLQPCDGDGGSQLSSAARIKLQKHLTRDRIGGSVGYYALLTKEELKTLRSLKGDRARRDHVYGLVETLPPDRLVVVGQEWSYLQFQRREGQPLGDGALLHGQLMHKGQSHWLNLVKDLSAESAELTSVVDDIAPAALAMSEEDLRLTTFLNDPTVAMSEDVAERTGQAGRRIADGFVRALDAGLSALFVCDHFRQGPISVPVIDE